MKILLSGCLFGLLIGAPMYMLYWNLFRPVLLKRLKYRLFKCRDDMRLLLISETLGDRGKAYPLIERFCNMAISKIDNIDLPSLMAARPDKRVQLEVERDISVIMESPLQLRNFFFQMSTAVMGAACANSPGFLILAAPLVIFSVTILWFQKTKVLATNYLKRALGSFYIIQPC